MKRRNQYANSLCCILVQFIVFSVFFSVFSVTLWLVILGGASLAAEPAHDRFGDPLPDGAVARLGSLRMRNDQANIAAAFSADGKSLLVGGPAAISVWDLATGKAAQRMAIKNIAGRRHFSADGKTLILSGFDNILRVVDATTGAERHTLNHAKHGQIRALDVSRDGKLLVAIHQTSIALWSIADGKLLHEFKGPPFVPLSPYGLIALTGDGKQLVLPHADGSLHLVDAASGKEVRAFEIPPPRPGFPPSQRLHRLALSPDGRYLAFGGPITPLTVCDVATGKRLRELMPSQGILEGLTFTPNGRFLAVGTYTDIRVFGVLSGKEIRKIPVSPSVGNTLAFSPDGRMLAALRGGYAIDLWDLAADRQPHPIVGHKGAIQSLTFFPDGKRLVAADSTNGMMVWDVASGRDLARLQTITPCVSLAVGEDGESVRFTGFDVAAHHWDLRTGREESQRAIVGLSTNQVAMSPDGRSMAILAYGGPTKPRQLRLHNLKDNKFAELTGLPEQGWISHMVFAPDSRRLAATSNDGVRLWNRDTAALVHEFKSATPARQPMYLSFAGDGRSLALFDGMARIREIASERERLQIPATGGVSSLAYSADARYLALGQSDGKIVVYSAVSGKQLALWEGKQGLVRALAFGRASGLLASGGEDGTILVWKVPDDQAAPPARTADEAVALWQALASEDAASANRALAGLTAAPKLAVPLIKERFRTTGKPPSAERLARLIADLDDDAFKVRERAMRELAEAGADAADALRAALADDPSAEKKGRIEKLLVKQGKGGDVERMRCLRAIEVLERIGTPPAKDVLRELAEKDIGTALRDEIRASLWRLEKRR